MSVWALQPAHGVRHVYAASAAGVHSACRQYAACPLPAVESKREAERLKKGGSGLLSEMAAEHAFSKLGACQMYGRLHHPPAQSSSTASMLKLITFKVMLLPLQGTAAAATRIPQEVVLTCMVSGPFSALAGCSEWRLSLAEASLRSHRRAALSASASTIITGLMRSCA